MIRIKKYRLRKILAVELLAFSCSLAYGDWQLNGSNNKTTPIPVEGKAVCYKGSTYYTSIYAGLEDASSGDTVYVIPGTTTTAATYTENNDLVIDSGVTLVVPYDGTTYKNSNYSANDTSQNKLITRININGDIKVYGNLYLGGFFRTNYLGRYTSLRLSTNSSITVYNGGNFECYGIVDENSQKHNGTAITTSVTNLIGDNGVYDNSNDPNRYIEIQSGGKLVSPFYMEGFPGSGSTIKSLVAKNICPFNTYNFNNLRTYVLCKYGSTYEGVARISMSASGQSYPMEENVSIVGTDSLFLINDSSSSIGFEFCTTNLSRIYLNKNITLGHIVINLDSAVSSVVGTDTIDTANYFLPIHYKFNIFCVDNGTINIGYNVKFLPGSVFKVCEGSTLNINNSSNINIFKKDSFVWSGTGTSYDYNGTNDAYFINNGTLNLTNENVKFGGNIYTESANGNSLINTSIITNQNNFIVTSDEGMNNDDFVTSLGSAVFYDPNSNITETKGLKYGQKFFSNTSIIQEKCHYLGNFSNIYKININVAENDYKFKVVGYRVYISNNTSPSLSNASELTAGITENSRSFDVFEGYHINIYSDTRSLSTTITSPSSLTFSNNTWYSSQNLDVSILANEGVQVRVYCTNDSGAGGEYYEMFESLDNGSSFSSLGTKKNTAGALWTIIKNSTFKMAHGNDKSAGISSTIYYYIKETTTKYIIRDDIVSTSVSANDEGDATKNPILNSSDSKTFTWGNTYIAENCYSIYYQGKSTMACIIEGTKILLSNGTYINVEDLNINDEVMVFDHFKGILTKEKIFFNYHTKQNNTVTANILTLYFDNNESISIHFDHGFFDKTLNKYVYINNKNFNDYINHDFVTIKNKKISTTKLLKGILKLDTVKVYSPVSMHHLNVITNDLLSITGEIEGWFNFFDYNQKMQYINIDEDIKKYGLYDYNEFKDYISETIYNVIPIKYLKISVGKGYTTKEDILNIMLKYLSDK